MKSTIFLHLALFILGADGAAAQSAAPAKVAVMPFRINAPSDFDYLSHGIFDMLSTRLAIPGKTVVISGELIAEALQDKAPPSSESEALALGEAVGADYVLYGSLTMLGESISTDARFIGLGDRTGRVVFSRSGEKPGEVIAHIDQLSETIKADVFGIGTAAQPPPVREKTPAAPKTPENAPAVAAGTVAGGGIIQMEKKPQTLDLSRSKRFKLVITGLAVADVDGDGLPEVVFSSRESIQVLRFEQGAFRRIARFESEGLPKYIGVDAVDIDGNGRAEIFVTALSANRDRLESFVLELDGRQLKVVGEPANRYYRSVDLPGRGKVLLGQDRSAFGIFSGGVHEMAWRDGTLVEAGPLTAPGAKTVYGFAVGDILNDGRHLTVRYTSTNKLRILDERGAKLWTGDQVLGGSPLYVEAGQRTTASQDESRERFYLPQRIFVGDLDGDGINEVITPSNDEIAGNYLKRLKLYKKGRIAALAWNANALYPQWKTLEFEGYIGDMAIADLDGDGGRELVFAVVTDSIKPLDTPKSTIYTVSVPGAPSK